MKFGTTVVKRHSTRFVTDDGQKLYFSNYGRSHWQFVAYDPSMPQGMRFAAVGPIYATKEELLADARRYAEEYGFPV